MHDGASNGQQDDLWDRQRDAFGEFPVVARNCPLCGRDNASVPDGPYSLSRWSVKTCASCGFTYQTSAPDYAVLVDQLAWEKSARFETERRAATRGLQQAVSKKTRWRMKLLPRKKLPALLARHAAPGNVVDLGCGDGNQLAGIDDAFVPHGVEISRAAAERANALFAAKGGRAVNAPSIDGLRQFPDGYFAAATLRSYLEHETNPLGVLVELRRTLRPGGVAIVKVPNFASLNRRVMGRRWCGLRYPDHVNYFTPATLRAMGRKAGFDTWFGLTWRLPTSDNMWALLKGHDV